MTWRIPSSVLSGAIEPQMKIRLLNLFRKTYADFKIWKSAGSLQSQPQTDFTAMMIWLGGADGGPPPFYYRSLMCWS
jgi:hypothetical protein